MPNALELIYSLLFYTLTEVFMIFYQLNKNTYGGSHVNASAYEIVKNMKTRENHKCRVGRICVAGRERERERERRIEGFRNRIRI